MEKTNRRKYTQTKPRKQWTQEEVKYVEENYNRGSNREIANKFNVTLGSLQSLINSYKLKIPKDPRRTDEWEFAFIYLTMYDFQDHQIAKHLGRTQQTISIIRRKKFNFHRPFNPHLYVEKGRMYGFITTIEKISDSSWTSSSVWKCLCHCGREIILSSIDIVENVRCVCDDTLNKVVNKVYYREVKHGAIQRNLEFSVSIEYLEDLYRKQNGKCAISGRELSVSYNRAMHYVTHQTASLDRIDSSKGYIEGNVQWLHRDINFMKWDFSVEYFFDMCKAIVTYNKLIED